MTDVCAWCDDEIADDESYVEVITRPYNAAGDGHPVGDTLAVFHDSPQPCYSEARDYGWSQ